MSIGERLNQQRKKLGLTLGQVAEYEGVSKTYLSSLERGVNEPNVWGLVARLARRYDTTTDYLLGVTDNPSPRRDADLPPSVRDLTLLALDLNDARQRELLAHAQVLRDAQRAANLSEYDRLLAVLGENDRDGSMVAGVEDMLRAVTAGDTARAELLFANLIDLQKAKRDKELLK